MTRILAIADEVEDSLGVDTIRGLRPDLVLSGGDLPFDYLEFVVTVANVPLLYVLGNHDPAVARRPPAPVLTGGVTMGLDDPLPADPGPGGCTGVDGRVVEAAGLLIGGLGGSPRYRLGPNQYTEGEMSRRARRLVRRCRLRHPRRGLDVLLTHAPPRGVGDDDDPAHRGFEALHGVVAKLRPSLLVHGHVHPHGRANPARRLGGARVVNAVGFTMVELDPTST